MTGNKNRFYFHDGRIVQLGDVIPATVMVNHESELPGIADKCLPGTVAYLPGGSKSWELGPTREWSLVRRNSSSGGGGSAAPTAALQYGGTVATADDLLEIENPAVGILYIVQEDGHSYAWDGSLWDDLGVMSLGGLSDETLAMLAEAENLVDEVGDLQDDMRIVQSDIEELKGIAMANGASF